MLYFSQGLSGIDGFGRDEAENSFKCMIAASDSPYDIDKDAEDDFIQCTVLGFDNPSEIENYYCVDCRFPDSNYQGDFFPIQVSKLLC